jgi:hypothetical protein
MDANRPLIIPRDAEPGWRWVLPRGVTLTLGEDRQLRDAAGTIYAAMDERLMTDNDNRAGAAGVYLPADSPFSQVARPHEFQTSSTTYQKYNTNLDAIESYIGHLRAVMKPTRWNRFRIAVARLVLLRFQDGFWDNPRTLWKKEPLP